MSNGASLPAGEWSDLARFLQRIGLLTIGSPTSHDVADITAHLAADPPQIAPG